MGKYIQRQCACETIITKIVPKYNKKECKIVSPNIDLNLNLASIIIKGLQSIMHND